MASGWTRNIEELMIGMENQLYDWELEKEDCNRHDVPKECQKK
jgi:hypothetical protein